MRAAPIALLLLAACGGGGASAADAGVPDAGEVRGIALAVHVTEDGESTAPVDLSLETIGAWSAGAYHAGAGGVDGAFAVPGVPAGEYTLQVGTLYVTTSAREVDLSRYAPGRPGVGTIAAASSGLLVDVDGLAPWQPGVDDLELYAPEAGALAFLVGSLPGGATQASGVALHLPGPNFPAIDGEPAWLTQLAFTQAGGVDFTAIAGAVMPAPFTLVDGGDVTIAATLTPAPGATTTLRWDQAAMFDAAFALAPQSHDCGAGLRLYAQPAAATDLGRRARLLRWLGGDVDGRDVTYGFGDPFPAGWLRFAVATTGCLVDVPGSPPHTVASEVAVTVPLAGAGVTAIDLAQGPVSSPRWNGALDAFAAQDGVGSTPTLSWQRPALGATERVVVTVARWSGAVIDGTWTLVTTGDSVTLPPGVLEPGRQYSAWIDAHAGVDPARPLVTTLPHARSGVVVGMFTP